MPPPPSHSPPIGPRYQPLLVVLAAACSGIVLDRYLSIPPAPVVVAALLGWACWFRFWRAGRVRSAGLVLLLVVAATAACWHHLRWNLFAAGDLGFHAPPTSVPVCLEATVRGGLRQMPAPPYDPMRLVPVGRRTRIALRAVAVRQGTRWCRASGRTVLTVDGDLLGVHVGDRLRIFAKIRRLSPAPNPGEFDYAAYARSDRCLVRLSAISPDCVRVVRPAPPVTPARWVDRLRSRGRWLLRQHIDPERSQLAAALLLGAREEIDRRRTGVFVETGTAHLLAISGLHVGILAWAVWWLTRLMLLSRRRSLALIVAVTITYTLLTGARPPAVRATILVAILAAAPLLGRRSLPLNSLAAAGLAVLALNPADLFRTGVQLSFLAVAALMWFIPRWFDAYFPEQDPLDRLIDQSRGWWWRATRGAARAAIQIGVAGAVVWLVTFPLIMATFHLFSPIGLVLNLVLWLPIGTVLLSGFALLALGTIAPPVAPLLGWCCDRTLWFLEACIGAAHRVPGGHFWVVGPPRWWLLGGYGAIALLAAVPALRPGRRGCLLLATAWIAAGWMAGRPQPPHGRLRCTILSVGHGESVLLQLPTGKNLLYDAGRLSSPDWGASSIASSLWAHRITHLDALFLSHADADHYNAVPELLRRFSVGTVYVPPGMFDRRNSSLEYLRNSIRRHGIPIEQLAAGDRLDAGECRIDVLHPPREGISGGDNTRSLVVSVAYGGRRILLPGDLESEGLDRLLKLPPRRCDVLLAPHHGSWRSDPPGLATWCRPRWVVVSGRRDPRGQPMAEAYRASGAEVLYTEDRGAVEVLLGDRAVRLRTTLPASPVHFPSREYPDHYWSGSRSRPPGPAFQTTRTITGPARVGSWFGPPLHHPAIVVE